MKNVNWIHQTSDVSISINLANVTHADATFIKDFIALYTDPAVSMLRSQVESGRCAVKRLPDGRAALVDLEHWKETPPADLIEFAASFTRDEWDALKPARTPLLALARANVLSARNEAARILGYVTPIPRLHIGAEQ